MFLFRLHLPGISFNFITASNIILYEIENFFFSSFVFLGIILKYFTLMTNNYCKPRTFLNGLKRVRKSTLWIYLKQVCKSLVMKATFSVNPKRRLMWKKKKKKTKLLGNCNLTSYQFISNFSNTNAFRTCLLFKHFQRNCGFVAMTIAKISGWEWFESF